MAGVARRHRLRAPRDGRRGPGFAIAARAAERSWRANVIPALAAHRWGHRQCAPRDVRVRRGAVRVMSTVMMPMAAVVPSQNEIFEHVKTLLVELFEVEPQTVTMEARSEERRGGKACVSKWNSRWAREQTK